MFLYSVFFVAKGITYLESKGVYSGALIKKHNYWPKGVPGDLIDTHFRDKEVSDIGMLEARNQDAKSFIILCMKNPDHVMKIM